MGIMTYAFALAPATVAAPVDFLRLPLVAVGGLIYCAALIAARSGKATLAEQDFTREETS
ncbi:hypothetical protein [Rhizobium sullae]|uniref:Uncharacterized protein n=1 Tax=Rhizobium sullae TaxID=50338 RepID=A0A4R3PQI1_RHISU|nr:hypothetical protein [Rhizobium sullae]TCU04328.1 hypothetical protein EV132_1417 [Rhizobium sullae]